MKSFFSHAHHSILNEQRVPQGHLRRAHLFRELVYALQTPVPTLSADRAFAYKAALPVFRSKVLLRFGQFRGSLQILHL